MGTGMTSARRQPKKDTQNIPGSLLGYTKATYKDVAEGKTCLAVSLWVASFVIQILPGHQV